MPGVFISRGMTLAVPPGGITVSLGPEGFQASDLKLHVHFDVCPTWCELAVAHCAEAKSRGISRAVAWSGTNENKKGETLEREFEASMQAIMAAAIAVDAFYAVVQPHVTVPENLLRAWRDKRTARYIQITEILRRGFRLKKQGTQVLKQNLKELFRYRDLAVHPSGKIGEPILHPELDVGVEWRFAYYRAANAEALVNVATAMIWDLAHNGKPANDGVGKYMDSLKPRLASIFPNGHPLVPMTPQAAA